MKNDGHSPMEAVLVVGSDKIAYSLAVCLLQAGHAVTLYTHEPKQAGQIIHAHLEDAYHFQYADLPIAADYEIINQLPPRIDERLAIIISPETLEDKKAALREVESVMDEKSIIAINTESISLHHLQEGAVNQESIIGANWTEPVHTTLFLEIITNEHTRPDAQKKFVKLARQQWKKDPYILENGMGIRSKMMCAMVREAFYLIEKGYVTAEDVDRACRNDPGYYFPFAGNFRYMDLMGAYIYGVVMKDLNPNLSKKTSIPDFFKEIIANGQYGMESGSGFFDYDENEVSNWNTLFRKFSYQIQEIIDKYPFKYLEEAKEVK